MRIPIALIVMFASAVVAADPPTTLPATRPAHIDLSSPDATLRSLAEMLDQDDTNAYRAIVFSESDEQRRDVDAAVRLMLIGQHLIKAVQQHIGEADAARIAQNLGIMGMPMSGHDGDELRGLLEDASIKWKLTGEDAVLGDVMPEIRLRRVDGKWHWLMPHDKDAGLDSEKWREEFITALEDAVKAIHAGEIKTTDDLARRIWPTQMAPPTTQAASKP